MTKPIRLRCFRWWLCCAGLIAAALAAGGLDESLERGAELGRAGKFRAGLALARETAARYPKSAAAQIMLGFFHTRNRENLAAVDAYRRALTLEPGAAEASVGLGIAQTQAGLDRNAAATFEAGLARFPQDAMHRQAYGVLMVKRAEAGDAQAATRAASLFEEALAMDGRLAEPHYQLGSLALARGDAAMAVTQFEAAARKGLDDARLHYALARALRRVGREAEAESHLRLFRERTATR